MAQRKINVPATGAVASVAAKSAKAAVAPKPEKAKVAKPIAGITRTAATIAAGRAAFGSLSDRDNVYLGFFAKHANANGGKVTLTQLVQSGERPNTTSNKPNDAGVAIRLAKAGLIAYDHATQSISLTKTAATHAAAK